MLSLLVLGLLEPVGTPGILVKDERLAMEGPLLLAVHGNPVERPLQFDCR